MITFVDLFLGKFQKTDFIFRLVGDAPREQIEFKVNPDGYDCPYRASVALMVGISWVVP